MNHVLRTAAYVFLVWMGSAVSAANGQTSTPISHAAVSAEKCASLRNFQLPGMAVVITKTESVPAAPAGARFPNLAGPETVVAVPIPSYCRADGMISQRLGVDGKQYGIGFAIALPETWNGRFLFQGGGGYNGTVLPPLGAQAAGDTPALARGFAVVSTDAGHQDAISLLSPGQAKVQADVPFFKDQQASLDFAYEAVPTVTFVAKQIVAQYYKKTPEHSYFIGCSTGGREGMLVSQRYPTYFDGIVSGDPTFRTEHMRLAWAWVARAFNEIAPKDAAGKPDASRIFSAGDKDLLVRAILEECDSKDGLQDGMIFNFQACQFDPAVLTCKGEKSDTCLTAQQVGALKKAIGGPKDSRGRQIYPGYAYDTGIINIIVGKPWGERALEMPSNVDDEADAIATDSRILLTDTVWTNLSTFSGHGGKILFYHGMSDYGNSVFDTIGYYDRMSRDNGGPDRTLEWARLFLVPGMEHCRGGDATLDDFDLLSAVVDWVEQGKAPESVVATGKAFSGRSRPLCAYPKYAHYKGQGNTQKAENFECQN